MKRSGLISLLIVLLLIAEPVLRVAAQPAPGTADSPASTGSRFQPGPVELPDGPEPRLASAPPIESVVCSIFPDSSLKIYLPVISGATNPALAADVLPASDSEAEATAVPLAAAQRFGPETGVGTDFALANAFLYEGSTAVQQGLAPETIDSLRAAVLRGRTCTRDGEPLAGVQITILNHPEYGSTLTQADGMFDLAVNGGGPLTVNYARAGYLPAQRPATPAPRDYAWLPEVVLIPLDGRVTTANLTGSAPMQVARGNPAADSDGVRQATLLIPQGTTAQLVMADGSTQAVTQLNIRATEYTVGGAGPAAMPGSLPPSSGYTYALEYSVDEALAAGAVDVRFSQPLYHYLENFLDFPVGMIVPTGYYDRQKGDWFPSANGRVVKVVGVNGGLADLDTDGDGAADNNAALGVTSAERQKLAGLYSAGQTLWRVPIEHFTPWDCNWPYGPPPDATGPDQPPPINEPPKDKPDVACGSIIECQNQILRESVPLVGTPFTMNYSSDRVPGRTAAYHLDVPLTGPSLPQGLVRIELNIDVAGRRFTQWFPPSPNLTTSFTWDGRDAYGRTVLSRQPAAVIVGYTYRAAYMEPKDLEMSFSLFSGRPISGNSARQEVTIWQVSQLKLGGWDNRMQGLGGWNLDVHHAYDPVARVLFLGDGSRRSADSLGTGVIDTFAGGGIVPGAGVGDGGPANRAELAVPVGLDVGADGSVYIAESGALTVRRVDPLGIITTVAGTGAMCFPNTAACGDGGPATLASFSIPADVALGPDGSLYIADRGNHRIRRVGPDGIITTVAGTGALGFAGDGGPATAAVLSGPYGLDVGPDGSLYIADRDNSRIRKVGPNGIINTVAGDLYGFAGDGGPADEARLAQPWQVKVGPDGSLYILDYSNRRVRRVGPDGIIRTVAGNGLFGFSGDGGPATQARLSTVQGLAVGPDGSLYIGDSQNYRVRRVGPDGMISTVAGSANNGFSGDSGPATRARLQDPRGVALAPDGSLYLADTLNQRVRRVVSALPGFSVSDLLLASEDGLELYVFDGGGRHLRTLHGLTGAVLYQFTYDANFRLAAVTDGSGNVTTVQRAAGGAPTAIVGPYGQSTALALNSSGFLATITNPAGQAYHLATTAGGLLTSLTNPRGLVTTFTYDSLGRLIRHQNAAGGDQTLARMETATGYSVTRSTALGVEMVYHVEGLPSGNTQSVNDMPDGTQAETVRSSDGTRAWQWTDGAAQSLTLSPDPRWGMLAPVAEWMTTTLPSGLTSQTSVTRTAVLTQTTNPLSLAALTQTVRLNGGVYTSTYTAGLGTIIERTAAGRIYTTTINSLGQVLLEQPAGLNAIWYRYDLQGRLISQTVGTAPDARTELWTYNTAGQVATFTDAANRTTTYGYDAAGRLTSETRPDGQILAFTYDANGNLTSLTPPGRPAHTFSYTPADQLAQYGPPDVNAGPDATQYTYNADGQLVLAARPDGQTVAISYDSAGRRSAVAISRGTFTNTYEAATGELAGLQAPGGIGLAYSYDSALLTGETWSGPVAGAVTRTYNPDFQVSTLQVNGANPLLNTYDLDGLLVGAGALALNYHSQNGLLLGSSLGSITDTYAYNGFGEKMQYRSAHAGAGLYGVDYARDALGRITVLTETLGGATNVYAYSYDLAGRLVTVTNNGAPATSYSYDANGNRLTGTGPGGTSAGTYDDQDRLTQYGTTTYTYNAAGQRQTRTAGGQVTTYTYDALGNLLAVGLTDGPQISYLVDGANRRIAKLVNGVRVQAFIYEDSLRIAAQLDENNAVVSRFMYAGWDNVPDYMVKAGATYRLITDHQGSPRLVVNAATGAVVQRLDYDAYGRVLTDTNPGFQPFGFAGGLYDAATGLLRFGARDYEPEVGRWLVRDPLGLGGDGTNLYVYVGNDPVNGRDPTGLEDEVPPAPRLPYKKQLSNWVEEKLKSAREKVGQKTDQFYECRTRPGGEGAAACLKIVCLGPTKFGAGGAGAAGADKAVELGHQAQDRYQQIYDASNPRD